MKHAVITNIPQNPKEILDAALEVSFNSWVDEKGTTDNPSHWKRRPSKLTYNEAFEIIQGAKPHWVFSYRNLSYICKEQDHWEFGGCNIGKNDYGDVFIWIQVEPDKAQQIFNKYGLEVKWY
jgi:hypothetical protein